jgi:transglutaminase-like putative cysteine protease
MTHDSQSDDLPGLISLHVGCELGYQAEESTHAVTLIEPHSTLQSAIREERWEPATAPARSTDLYGNVTRRLDLPPGASSIAYHGTVLISPDPEAMPAERDVQQWIEDLPPGLLHWLLPSRLCESDLMRDAAWELFGDVPRGPERMTAICDWIHENIAYGVPSVPATTVTEIFERRGGMCRDFAHLGVTFCRALGIPARYVCGYLPDIGIPGPFPTMDFHAWFEVWLGERWWTYDARFNMPRIGRVPIAHGRDAVDVAMVTTYGDARLETMKVWSDVVGEPEPAAATGGVA